MLILYGIEAPRIPNPPNRQSSRPRPQASRLHRSFSSLRPGIKIPGRMAAPAAGALAPLAGWAQLPWCSPAPLYCRRNPPRLKVAKRQPDGRRFPPASLRKCAAVSDHGRRPASEYQIDDDEPLWLAVFRNLALGLKGLIAFLAEQPRQLKHLEWPGLQNTLKMATLTLVLVAVFIIALSTVDAALCYGLAWLLRKSA